MDPVVHFEMPYDDAQRVAAFYAAAFGWHTEALGAEMGEYVLATTAPSDSRGSTTPGAINGGFFARKPDFPSQHPSVVIAVQDIAASSEKVRAAGGRVLGEPMEIPGVGKYVSFMDPEGNRISMLQPEPRAAG